MEIDEKLRKYITENEELINTNNFKDLYRGVVSAGVKLAHLHELTEILYLAGIDPLQYLEKVPEVFLLNSTQSSVDIPDNIKIIGDFAFMAAKYLKKVHIGNSVTAIGDGAFKECGSLPEIVIPDNVKKLGMSLFDGCISLERIQLSGQLQYLPEYMFRGCDRLSKVEFNGTLDQWKALVQRSSRYFELPSRATVYCTNGAAVSSELGKQPSK